MNKNVRMALVIGGIVVVVLIVLPLVFGSVSSGWHGGGWGMMGPGMMGGFGWGWFMPVFWIVILGLIIWAVAASINRGSDSGSQDSSRPGSALEVLKERYARGEIIKEEYEEKKKDLE